MSLGFAPHSSLVTIDGRRVIASAEGRPTGPLGDVPGPAAVPELLTKIARTSETTASPGSWRATRAQRLPPVHSSPVPAFAPKGSAVPGSGPPSDSSTPVGPKPLGTSATATRAADGPSPLCTQITPRAVNQKGAQTRTLLVLASACARSTPPAPRERLPPARSGRRSPTSTGTARTIVGGNGAPPAPGKTPVSDAPTTVAATTERASGRSVRAPGRAMGEVPSTAGDGR